MKRMAIVTMAAAVAASALADGGVRTRNLSGAERRAKREAKIQAEGGLVTKPYDGRYVVIENAQTLVAEGDLLPKESGISDVFKFPVKVVKKGETVAKTAIHITVAQEPGAPTLLVAPEIPWAQVNVKALAADGATGEALVARTQKEVWRAFMMCCGAANSNMQPCVMRTVKSLGDLDASPVRVPCPESFMKVMAAGRELGLQAPERATYQAACEAGWAPPPATERQREIAEKFGKGTKK